MGKGWFWFVPGAALLFLLALDFHLRSHLLNGWADAGWIVPAQEIRRRYLTEGLGPALSAAYFVRGWRPVLHPLFGVVGLLLSDGRIHAGVALANLSFYVFFLAGLWLVFAEFLEAPSSASIAALFVASFPWIFCVTLYFHSELYAWTFLVYAFWFWLRSENLTRPKMAWLSGICLGLMLCCRPADGAANIGPPLALYLGYLAMRRRIGGRELLWAGLSVGTTVSFFLYAWFREPSSYVGLLLPYALVQLLWAAAYRAAISRSPERAPKSRLFALLAPAQWIPFVWFAPALANLRAWISFSAYSPVAAAWRNEITNNRLGYVADMLRELGGLTLVLAAGLAVAVVLMGWKRNPARARQRARWGAHASAGLAAVLAILAGSDASTVKYVLPAVFAWVGFALVTALDPAFPAIRGRRLVVLALAAVQFGYVGSRVLSGPNLFDSYFSGRQWERIRPWTGTEPLRPALERIRGVAGRPARVLLLPCFSGDGRSDFNALDYWNALAREQESGLEFVASWNPPRSASEELKTIASMGRLDYVLIQDAAPNPAEFASVASSLVAQSLLSRVKRRELRPVAEIPVSYSDGHASTLFLLDASETLAPKGSS